MVCTKHGHVTPENFGRYVTAPPETATFRKRWGFKLVHIPALSGSYVSVYLVSPIW